MKTHPGTLILRALFLALLVFGLTASSFAQLARVGPINRNYGYPQWYQDTTGLALEFCDNQTSAELNGGWCVLLPPVPPSAPEVFPTNFSDEHFYMISNAGDRRAPVPGTANTVVATFVGALEGAFAAGPVRAGDQMVFARVRMLLNPVPYDGNYTFYTPFGQFNFPNQVAGDKIFFTEDIGLTPGNFTEALNGRIGPFLLPSTVPGGAEMPPVSAANPTPDTDPAHFGGAFAPTPYPANGRKYIADPARIGPITGGKTNTGAALYNVNPVAGEADQSATRNPNIFRIEGPNGFVYETYNFSLGGRVFEGAIAGSVKVDRASYARTAAGVIDVDVYASGSPATQGRIPAAPPAAVVATNMSYYDAACTPTLDALGNPGAPYSLPATPGTAHQMFNDRSIFYGHSNPTTLPLEVCVQSNAVDANGNTVATYTPGQLGDQIFISDARYDRNTQTLSVIARSSDALPAAAPILSVQGYGVIGAGNQLIVNPVLAAPDKVTVLSSARGLNSRQVFPAAATGGTVTLPVANNDTATTAEDTLNPSINVLLNDSVSAGAASVAIAGQGVLGTATVNADMSISYAPKLNANGTDTFTYTVTDTLGNISNTGSVTVTITPVNDPPVAINDAGGALAGNTSTINVLANDTDPDGLADLASARITTGNAALGLSVGQTFPGGIVTITVPAGTIGGNYQFQYVAVDQSGTPSAAPAIVTIAVSSVETITPTKNIFTSRSFRWTVTGTVTPNSGQTMRITYLDGTFKPVGGSCAAPTSAAGFVLATPVVDVTNTYTYDVILSSTSGAANPTNSGGNSSGFWCSPPKNIRITDINSGVFTAPQAIQFK